MNAAQSGAKVLMLGGQITGRIPSQQEAGPSAAPVEAATAPQLPAPVECFRCGDELPATGGCQGHWGDCPVCGKDIKCSEKTVTLGDVEMHEECASEPIDCSSCQGTGEGSAPGRRCLDCQGRGYFPSPARAFAAIGEEA